MRYQEAQDLYHRQVVEATIISATATAVAAPHDDDNTCSSTLGRSIEEQNREFGARSRSKVEAPIFNSNTPAEAVLPQVQSRYVPQVGPGKMDTIAMLSEKVSSSGRKPRAIKGPRERHYELIEHCRVIAEQGSSTPELHAVVEPLLGGLRRSLSGEDQDLTELKEVLGVAMDKLPRAIRRKNRKCGSCGGKGHRRDSKQCPNYVPKPPRDRENRKCGSCGQKGHRRDSKLCPNYVPRNRKGDNNHVNVDNTAPKNGIGTGVPSVPEGILAPTNDGADLKDPSRKRPRPTVTTARRYVEMDRMDERYY